MEFKGTKGKWYADKLDDIFIRSEENKCNICTMDGANYKYEEKTANAQLISKAPEMLEMLIDITINPNSISNDSGEGVIIDFEDFNKIIQLIKEATTI